MSVPTTAPSAMAVARLPDYLQLTKPRLSSLVLVTVSVAFFLASPETLDPLLLVEVLLGMGLVVGGVNALNQYVERDADARMLRTQSRPLPDGRLWPSEAAAFGTLATGSGLLWLYLSVNLWVGTLAAAAAVLYLFVYTPLKRCTPWCTPVGAIPGAIPPLVGWAAARGQLDVGAWSIFALLLLWQMPHFLAISRLYREDYARGGFPMLAVVDEEGSLTGRTCLACALMLLPVTLLPAAVGIVGKFYFGGALLLGMAFLAVVFWSVHRPDEGRERWVFLGSLLHLTGLMVLMLLDRQPLF
ncbi:MAG: heme o synthase [Acidobacteriota bacterium]